MIQGVFGPKDGPAEVLFLAFSRSDLEAMLARPECGVMTRNTDLGLPHSLVIARAETHEEYAAKAVTIPVLGCGVPGHVHDSFVPSSVVEASFEETAAAATRSVNIAPLVRHVRPPAPATTPRPPAPGRDRAAVDQGYAAARKLVDGQAEWAAQMLDKTGGDAATAFTRMARGMAAQLGIALPMAKLMCAAAIREAVARRATGHKIATKLGDTALCTCGRPNCPEAVA